MVAISALGVAAVTAFAQPRIVVEREWAEFGAVDDSRTLEDRIVVRNAGDETLVIDRVGMSCSCVALSDFEGAGRRIEPGGALPFVVRFNPSGRRGKVVQTITLGTNDPSSPEARVRMRAEVTPIVLATPRSVRWGEVPKGRGAIQQVTLWAERDGFTVTHVTTERDELGRVDYEIGEAVRVLQDGEPVTLQRVMIGLREDAVTGMVGATAVLHTNDERRAEIPIQLSAEIVGDLRAEPKLVVFNRVPTGQPASRTFTLRSESGERFRVLGFETEGRDGDKIAAVCETGDAARLAHRITVTLDALDERTFLSGGLVVKTDREDEPEHRVPFNGVVR